MKVYTLKQITPEEHEAWCKKQIEEKGLDGSVKEQLDEWVSICHPLGYMGFGEAIERATTILDLIKAFCCLQNECIDNSGKEKDNTSVEF